MERKQALILRVGGLGDTVILTPVAKVLHERGFDVTYAVGSPTGEVHELYKGLPYLKKVLKTQRLNGIDVVKATDDDKEDHWVSVEIFKRKFGKYVFDFKYSVEDNSTVVGDRSEWRRTISSNYMNWVDLSFGWANIDWTQIPDFKKRPEIALDQKYTEWADKVFPADKGFKVIGIQLQASTLIRSWYRAGELPEMIHKMYKNDVVLIFDGKRWIALSRFGRKPIELPEGYDPICCSVALVKKMDVLISADSGMSHVAEAVETKSIVIYTTVPAWTRVQYYKYTTPIEATCDCHPCFTLDLYCPLEKEKAKNSLSERETYILEASRNGTRIEDVARHFNSLPRAINDEFTAANQKLQALSATMPACVASITPEMILQKLSEILEHQSPGANKFYKVDMMDKVELAENIKHD